MRKIHITNASRQNILHCNFYSFQTILADFGILEMAHHEEVWAIFLILDTCNFSLDA